MQTAGNTKSARATMARGERRILTVSRPAANAATAACGKNPHRPRPRTTIAATSTVAAACTTAHDHASRGVRGRIAPVSGCNELLECQLRARERDAVLDARLFERLDALRADRPGTEDDRIDRAGADQHEECVEASEHRIALQPGLRLAVVIVDEAEDAVLLAVVVHRLAGDDGPGGARAVDDHPAPLATPL